MRSTAEGRTTKPTGHDNRRQNTTHLFYFTRKKPALLEPKQRYFLATHSSIPSASFFAGDSVVHFP